MSIFFRASSLLYRQAFSDKAVQGSLDANVGHLFTYRRRLSVIRKGERFWWVVLTNIFSMYYYYINVVNIQLLLILISLHDESFVYILFCCSDVKEVIWDLQTLDQT